jgi:hypothetical protein
MKIFIHGGLGNQLFQLAYAHLSQDSIYIYPDTNARSDRKFDLEPVIKNCPHIIKEINLPRKLLELRRKLSMSSKFIALPKISSILRRIKNESQNFSFHSRGLNNKFLNVGYFQHWKYIDGAFCNFGDEILQSLKKIQLPYGIDINYSQSIVVHLRLGDYLSIHKETLGVLDSKYIFNNIQEINVSNNFHVIFLTDDLVAAENLVTETKLNSYSIYGPSKLTAWQTLRVMSEAKFLIAANSTLSWWGSYLASKRGGICLLPSPWFKNYHMADKKAFYYPESFTRNSSFC